MRYIYYDKNNIVKMVSNSQISAPDLTEVATTDVIPPNDPDSTIKYVNAKVVQVDSPEGARKKRIVAQIMAAGNITELKQAILNIIK